jgi:superfamily II DNA/RNA helicase
MLQKMSQASTEDKLLGFIRNAGYKSPTLLQKTVLPLTLQGRDIVVEAGSGEGRTGLFLISLLLQTEVRGEGITNLIVAPSNEEIHKILRQFRKFSAKLHKRPHIVGLGINENIEREHRILSGHPDIVAGTSARIIDHLRRKNIALQNVKKVILIIPDNPEQLGYNKDVLYIYSKLPGKSQTQAYCPNLDVTPVPDTVLKRPIQVAKSDWGRIDDVNRKGEREEKMMENSAGRNSDVQMHIKSILKMIKEDSNPHELNEFRRIFRKHTPIHLRAYFAAYLLKASIGSAPSTQGGFKSLFISVGKNKRVFPKDLKELFISQIGITEAEIGNVKILENYSFVDIAEAHAQKAIDTLNASEFRGRKITVNYSRKKGKRTS